MTKPRIYQLSKYAKAQSKLPLEQILSLARVVAHWGTSSGCIQNMRSFEVGVVVDVAVAEELAASTVAAVAVPELEGMVVGVAGPEVPLEEPGQAEQVFGSE